MCSFIFGFSFPQSGAMLSSCARLMATVHQLSVL